MCLLVLLIFSCSKNHDTSNPTTGCVSGNGTTDIDGNVYTSVKIGTQEWMVENLKVTKYRDGTPIPNIMTGTQWRSLTTGAWCYNNNDAQYNNPYGKLYNWYAVTDPRGLAPSGWHIPTDGEWTILVNYLGGDTIAGTKMKEIGLTHWQVDNPGGVQSTNSSCFTALPGWDSESPMVGLYGDWWSSTDAASAGAWFFGLAGSSPGTDRGTAPKYYGCSIRCIKD